MSKYRIVKETNALGEGVYYVESRVAFLWWVHTDPLSWFDDPLRFHSLSNAQRYIRKCINADKINIEQKERGKLRNKIVRREVVG